MSSSRQKYLLIAMIVALGVFQYIIIWQAQSLTQLSLATSASLVLLTIYEIRHTHWTFDLKYLANSPPDASKRLVNVVFQEIVFVAIFIPTANAMSHILGQLKSGSDVGYRTALIYGLPVGVFAILALIRLFRHFRF